MSTIPTTSDTPSPDIARLFAAAGSLRFADQIAVAGTPLVAAAVFGAGSDVIGLMIAAQGSAWLIASLPAGVVIDRMDPLVAGRRTLLLALAGFAVLAGGILAHHLPLFTFGAFVTACAAVIWFLAEQAGIQKIVPPTGLARANARIQMIQSSALLAGPALMGFLVARDWTLVAYLGAAAMLGAGLLAAARFTPAPPAERPRRSPLAELREGLAFVAGQPLLVGIVGCALFWNMAMFALATIFVPFALGRLALTPDAIGLALTANGVGSVLASTIAVGVLARLPPRAILIFGPASSICAALLFLAAPGLGGWPAIAGAQFILGFGPILWFVCQTTIRQLVTPPGLLARVGAVIQVAIYGVRSIGALIGGFVGARYGLEAGGWVVVALFACSTAMVLASPLARLARMPAAVGR